MHLSPLCSETGQTQVPEGERSRGWAPFLNHKQVLQSKRFCRDFRIKQCTEVDTSWIFISHHEMGHIEYYLQYAPQPTVFRDGANPGLHGVWGKTWVHCLIYGGAG